MNHQARYMRLSTTEVSDALNSLGYCGGLKGIRPCKNGIKIFGSAFTVARTINDEPNYCEAGEFIDQVPAGSVVVIDNLGITDSTCWGGILTICAKRNRIQGTVINGIYRDADVIEASGYPVFSKGVFMVTGKGKTRLRALNIPITIEGISIRPGDLVLGDSNGVVVIPFESADKVLVKAEHVHQVEKEIERLVEQGVALQEARKKMKYNQLSAMKASSS